jgi:hypothetical protein
MSGSRKKDARAHPGGEWEAASCGLGQGLCAEGADIDTADGQVIRNFEDSLLADYPDWKVIYIDLDNKA